MTEAMALTYKRVSDVLEKLVAERGADSTYVMKKAPMGGNTCLYSTQDGEADCPVGYVLKELAPDLFDNLAFREWKAHSMLVPSGAGTITGVLRGKAGIASPRMRAALGALQHANDKGHELSYAVQEFHNNWAMGQRN